MDHSEAVAAGMVERYLLGELRDADLDAFEEHYFSCPECLSEVKAALDFRDAVKSVGGRHQAETSGVKVMPAPAKGLSQASGIGWYWGAWAAVVGAAAVGLAGYQGLVTLPALRSEVLELQQPYVLSGGTVLRMGNLAVSGNSSGRHAGQPLQFFIELPTEAQFQEYQVHVEPPAGKPVIHRLSADQARESVVLMIPKAQAGTYKVLVYGKAQQAEPRLIQQGEIPVQ